MNNLRIFCSKIDIIIIIIIIIIIKRETEALIIAA